jgi:transposase
LVEIYEHKQYNKVMININHKLYPTYKQEQYLESCLWSAIGIENWVINQIRYLFDENGFPYKFMKPIQLRSILSAKIKGNAKRAGIPSRLINDCIGAVLTTFARHKDIYKVHFKSVRKKVSFYFNGDIKIDCKDRLNLPGLKTSIRISESGKFIGKLKKVTLIKKFNGWYASCCYDEVRKPIECIDNRVAGIDPGSKTALTLSDGTKYDFPKFYQVNEKRIAKGQRKSRNSKKVKAMYRKLLNQRKDHHHKLSTKLAQFYEQIIWSNDSFKGLIRLFGKSYSNLSLGAFRDLLSAKLAARNGGLGELIKVSNKYSTQTCSGCGSLSGPKGYFGLQVRDWTCSECGAMHDRDVNAAINTLILGIGNTSDLGKFVNQENELVCV